MNPIEELANDMTWLCVAKKVSGRDAIRALSSALGGQIRNTCECKVKEHNHLAETQSLVDSIIRQYVPEWHS
jgi:hypothetical protein